MASPPFTLATAALQPAAPQTADMAINMPQGPPTRSATDSELALEAVPMGTAALSAFQAIPGETNSSLPGAPAAGVRKPFTSRQASQRARQRSKARTEEIEAQVALAEAELRELEASQKQLEDRNALLESMTRMNLDPQQQPMLEESGSESPAASGAAVNENLYTIAADARNTLALSILGGEQQAKSAADVALITFDEFAMLYAAYAHKVEQCLAETNQWPTSPATALLRKWTCELSSLRVFLAMGHLKKYLSFSSVRLDGTAGPTAPQLSDAWYHELLVALQLTEAQQRDVLLLRRLFYAKLGALARDRQGILMQVPLGAAETAASTSNQLDQFADTARALQSNSDAELKTYMQVLSAFGRGILTIRQQAIGIVRGFPYIPEQPRFFEVLAALHNEPPITALTQSAGLDNSEHHAHWQRVVAYLHSVTDANLQLHVPLRND